jgi:hypothetical protein
MTASNRRCCGHPACSPLNLSLLAKTIEALLPVVEVHP